MGKASLHHPPSVSGSQHPVSIVMVVSCGKTQYFVSRISDLFSFVMMYTLKTATVNDTETIIRIAEKTWWPTYASILSAEQISYMLDAMYNTELIAKQIKNHEQTFLLLNEGNETVAFAGYSPYATESFKLHKLYCLPETQGKGYGRILIDAVGEKAREAGAKHLLLNVNRYNKAKSFYEKMGFGILREEDIDIGPFFMNDYIMQKAL